MKIFKRNLTDIEFDEEISESELMNDFRKFLKISPNF